MGWRPGLEPRPLSAFVEGFAMCRNIRTLFNFDPPATDAEVRAASLQFVRKISGFTKPSQANQAAFDHGVEEVARAARRLLDVLVTSAPARDREVEATKARARAAQRFGSGDGPVGKRGNPGWSPTRGRG
jgi:hypothetical protein